jgi:hypothetical protein
MKNMKLGVGHSLLSARVTTNASSEDATARR